MPQEETLAYAIEQEGFEYEGKINYQQQIDMLSDEAKAVTKDQIARSLNDDKFAIKEEVIRNLKALVRVRLANGQQVLPGNMQDALKQIQGTIVPFGW